MYHQLMAFADGEDYFHRVRNPKELAKLAASEDEREEKATASLAERVTKWVA